MTKCTDKERGGPTKSEDQRWISEEDENASMDITRVADGVSDSGEKMAVPLTAFASTDDESCAGGWGAMIDIGGAVSIIVDGCIFIMLFS